MEVETKKISSIQDIIALATTYRSRSSSPAESLDAGLENVGQAKAVVKVNEQLLLGASRVIENAPYLMARRSSEALLLGNTGTCTCASSNSSSPCRAVPLEESAEYGVKSN